MGTPQIAEHSLKKLIEAKHKIVGVFTREDKPVGRKRIITPPPVKVLALENEIEIYQPKTLKDETVIETIKQLNPDIIVVVAYGMILPKSVLDIPKYGCINLHVSLLPKYRGSAPIQWSVINGDTETGVTIMYMDEGLDTGDIINTTIVPIDKDETSGELFEKVTTIGANTLVGTLSSIENGIIKKIKQDESKVTFAPKLSKELALVNFDKNALETHNLIRGLMPWPIAFFMYEDKKIKITKSEVISSNGKTGEILSLKPLIIACKENAICLKQVVPEGKKPMDGSAWALGKHFKVGDVLE